MVLSRSAILMCLAAFAGACGGGERSIVDPPPPGSKNPTITLVPHGEDGAVASLLGWAAGIPGAEVTLIPVDSEGSGQTFTSNAAGTVALPQLTEGKKYLLSVRRVLTSQEAAKLGTGSEVVGFAGFDTISVASVSASPSFTVGAARKGSVVVSEWSFISKFALGLGNYGEGGFLEVYNNADTTVYLDGVIFAVGFDLAHDYPDYPCSMFTSLRLDPAGIWSQHHQAFPGNGRDYPLLPGEVAVVAADAIDHSTVSSGLLDLRGADFEMVEVPDVDNPSVPNMLDLSTHPPAFQFFSSLGVVAVLVTPGAVSDLPQQKDPRNNRMWRRFPADRILDVFATGTQYEATYPRCARLVHENFDRRHGIFMPFGADNYLTSVSRKSFGVAEGRIRLQDSRNSAVDFVARSRTPGGLP